MCLSIIRATWPLYSQGHFIETVASNLVISSHGCPFPRPTVCILRGMAMKAVEE